MMSFDLDDPLAGILSDGSDDSFFDDDIIGKKKPTKKKVSTPIAERKSALFDLKEKKEPKESLESRKESLFDLGEPKLKNPPLQDEIKYSKVDSKSPITVKRSFSKESVKTPILEPKNKDTFDKIDPRQSPAKKVSSSADKLDFIGDNYGTKKETPKLDKPMEKGKSSQSLFDDILGGLSTKTSLSQVTRPTTATKGQDYNLDSILNKSESKASTKTIVSATKTGILSSSVTKDAAKDDPNAKKSRANEDWLGLFKSKDDNKDEDDGMPAWLAGDGRDKKADIENKSKQAPEKENRGAGAKEEGKQMPQQVQQQPEISQMYSNFGHLRPPVSGLLGQFTEGATDSVMQLQGANDDITAEGANLFLQQQESQLMLALQLKAQEEKLAAMQARQQETQRVQREAALSHHSQLESMLQRQAAQRLQMQALIAAHQERITERIRALLGTTETNDPENPKDGDYGDHQQQETPHMKEKKQLLQLVQSLQENHDKEIDLMETSYRRQLAFLEVSIGQSEERMKEESEKLLKFYMEKIVWLEEHHKLHKKLTEDNLNSLADQHRVENELLRQQNLENIRVLQEHHAVLMENIRNAVKQEQVLIQDSASFSTDLKVLVTDVKEQRSQCTTLMDRVEEMVERTRGEGERSLLSRETQINAMIDQLKRERENFEAEKTESRDMARMLENRLKQMTATIEEDAASMKQKRMEFEFEKATVSKQTEFAKDLLKRKDEEIQMLREDIKKEYQDKISKINEEKANALKDSATIAREKVSIQNLKQELEKTKAELQAQLEEVAEERSKLNLEKQQTHMEEQRILAKSRDLELLAKSAIEKQTQADQKYAEAELIQKKYEDRIRRMQEHAVSLNAREKQIAKEKVALSRERLSLHNEKKQLESRMPCSLCKSQQNAPQIQYNNEFEPTFDDVYLNVPVSRDYGGANVSSAMNAIELEMAHLMSRNFNLKYSGGAVVNHDQLTETVGDNLHKEGVQESGGFKDYMDPKFMMLRLDVQQVLSNLDHAKKDTDQERNDE